MQMILASPKTRVQWVQENLIPEVAPTVCCVDDNFFFCYQREDTENK